MTLENEQRTPPWYALKVHVRSEANATRALEHHGFAPYCPTVVERRRYCDRMKNIEVPAFPGYVFCRFDLSRKSKILNSVAIEYIVGFGGDPAAIPDAQIVGLRRIIDAGGQTAPFLQRGQRVRVTHGSLDGLEGILLKEPQSGKGRLLLSVDVLHRSVSVSIEESYVMAV